MTTTSPPPETHYHVPEELRDIDALIAETESTKEGREALAQARAFLADTLYPNEVSIRTLRLKAGLSQKALSERMGVSRAHVAEIERHKIAVERETAVALAKALDTDTETVVHALSETV